jgi:hypothetical protein
VQKFHAGRIVHQPVGEILVKLGVVGVVRILVLLSLDISLASAKQSGPAWRLAVCDDAIHDLVNENRFDINLDGTPTPHRVDKKNRCIWMYEGTQEQFMSWAPSRGLALWLRGLRGG